MIFRLAILHKGFTEKAYLTKHMAINHNNENPNSSTQNSSPNSFMEIDPIISVKVEEVESALNSKEELEDGQENFNNKVEENEDKEDDYFQEVREIKFESVEEEIMKTEEENNLEIDKSKVHF